MNAPPPQDVAHADQFGYSIWLANSFDDVLNRRKPDTESVDLGAFAEVVRRSACTLLQARGGAGKTYTAHRVCDVLRARGTWTVVVPAVSIQVNESLTAWSPAQWAEAAGDPMSAAKADEANAGLIVIDGLNEVDRATGERILEAVGPLTATNPQVSFLITDRLTRRPSASPFWKHAALGPVPNDVIRRVAGTEPTEALSIPFYLERHSAGSAAHEILAESIGRYVDSERLPSLAAAAYLSYEKHNRRTIDRNLVVAAVGLEVWQAMLAAKTVVAVKATGGPGSEAPDFHFEHHLLHDYLAARHLATNDELWNGDGFDVITLKASSFDALALALTQVQNETAVEELVQRVYDWNFYAAAYMLEEDRGGDRRVGEALQLALLGALAEKRFDNILPTVIRVEDALRVQQSQISDELLAAADRKQIVGALMKRVPHQPPEWFASWLDHFRRADGSPASSQDVETITSAQPVVGWGAANALRRLTLSPQAQGSLRQLLAEHESSTVRWRAAHALGPHANADNLRSLKDVLRREPGKSWVAYGALRAEFEQIRQASAEVRRSLLAEMAEETSDLLATSGPLRNEAIRCLDVDPLPEDWHRDIEPLLVHLWQTADARGAAELAALAERLRRRKEAAADVA